MSENPELRQAELEEERRVRAAVHRWLGLGATVLVLVAIGVAIWRLNATLEQSGLGISLGDSMGIMAGALPWVLLLIALAVLFSLGTTRIFMGIEKLYRLVTGKKAAK